MKNKKEFTKIKELVTKAFYRLGVDNKPERLMLLIEDLIKRDITPMSLEKALDRHAECSNFLPTLADILKIRREQLDQAVYFQSAPKQIEGERMSHEGFKNFLDEARDIVEGGHRVAQ
jgi:hypothetical protein